MDKSNSDDVSSTDAKLRKEISRSKSLKTSTSKPSKNLFGICCVCHKTPQHSRKYYGHLFCIKCFHKYIWSAPSADVKSFSFEDLSKFTDQIKRI